MIEALHLKIIDIVKSQRRQRVMLTDQESFRINIVRQFPEMDVQR
jgi:hypothetical protein